MAFLKKLLVWIKTNWKLVLATLGTIGLILSLYFFREDLKELEIVKRKIDISKKKKEIIDLEGKREALAKDKNASKENLKDVDAKIKVIKADIAKRNAEIAKLALDKKLEELDKMGY